MIHLSYHPAFDAFNNIFRFLRIILNENVSSIEVDKLRILDYYLLFPWRAATIRLPQKDIGLRKVAKKLETEQDYATLPSGESLLERMRPSQTAALQTMAQDGVIDIAQLKNDTVLFTQSMPPDALLKRINERNESEHDRMSIIHTLNSYALLGLDGLKGRTALLEHRYDKI